MTLYFLNGIQFGNKQSVVYFFQKANLSVPIFCPTFVTSTSPPSVSVKWPRNEDFKNGFIFAVGRPEAEIIDFLGFDIILSNFLRGDVA